MNREGTAPDKRLGQHFLHDTHVIEKIATTVPAGVDAIVEVGPGKGALTRILAEHPLPLHLIEKDKRFATLLAPLVSDGRIHFQDALEMDFSHLPSKNIWLVSNLPYNVSVPLIRKFTLCPAITTMTLMFQKEVAEKVLSPMMNSLKALVQNYFSCRRLLKVPPGAFSPPPQVHSTVITFFRLKNPIVPLNELNDYEQFLRRLFNHRRKQVQKILRQMFPDGKGEAFLKEKGWEGSLRTESFHLTEIQMLYVELAKDFQAK